MADGTLPGPLPIAGARSPCREHGCRACCFDTRMPLLPGDIARLAQASGKPPEAFTVTAPGEPPRLANRDGACTFLGPDGCTVYAHRPAGCRIYPLVLDPESGRGVLDADCPHPRGFRVRPRDRAALAELVAALGLDPDAA